MRKSTPTFNATSRQGAEALATAKAAGAAYESTGRRVRFAFGALFGAVGGFFILSDRWAYYPASRVLLESIGDAGFWALVLLVALGTGVVVARWGALAWHWLGEIWPLLR